MSDNRSPLQLVATNGPVAIYMEAHEVLQALCQQVEGAPQHPHYWGVSATEYADVLPAA